MRAIVAPDCGYTSGDGDIAILVLSRHLIGVPTVPIRIEQQPRKDEELRIYGFGRCASRATPFTASRARRARSRASSPATSSPRPPSARATRAAPVYGEKGEIIGVVSASVMDGDETTPGLSLFTRVDVWPQLFSAAHEIANGASPGELPPYGDCRAPRQRASKR